MRTRSKTTSNLSKKRNTDIKIKLKRQKEKTKRKEGKIKLLKEKNVELKEGANLTFIKNYVYPSEIIRLAVIMNMQLGISLRGVSGTLKVVGEMLNFPIEKISHSTVRNWSLKLGQYFLKLPIDPGKYVLIADESVEIGRERLMLLLVVPIEKYSPIVPLDFECVKVLNLGVQESWSASDIVKKIKEKTEQNEIEIVYGISDKCSTLKKAMRDLDIRWIGDCTHAIANISKSLFEENKATTIFIIEMNKIRRKWSVSTHHLLVPQRLRDRDRFQTLFIIHKWAEKILQGWDSLTRKEKAELKFVKKNKTLIKTMRQCYEIIAKFSAIFKTKGIQKVSLKLWEDEMKLYKKEEKLSHKSKQFISGLNKYLKIQTETLPDIDQILCCSDVIESMFGKYKNKLMKIMTDDVLQITAYTKKITLEEVENAMLSINTNAVLEWKKNNTTESKFALLSKKRKLNKMVA